MFLLCNLQRESLIWGDPQFRERKKWEKGKEREREREKSLNRDARITDFFIFEQRDREKIVLLSDARNRNKLTEKRLSQSSSVSKAL